MKNYANPQLARPFIACLLALLLALTGCTSAPVTSSGLADQANSSVADNTATDSAAKPATKPFAIDSLYDLLVADVALARNQFDIALPKYLDQARLTGDPGVIEMAGRVANYMRDYPATLEMALLWLDREPDNPLAREAAMQAYAKLNDGVGALEQASWLYQHQDDSEAFCCHFDSYTEIRYSGAVAGLFRARAEQRQTAQCIVGKRHTAQRNRPIAAVRTGGQRFSDGQTR